MFGSFLPSLWSSSNQSLLGSREPTLLCNHVEYELRQMSDGANLVADAGSLLQSVRLGFKSYSPQAITPEEGYAKTDNCFYYMQCHRTRHHPRTCGTRPC